jgi:UDP-2-acetamido-2,6-beta-L-arabino-hexul-4-ose reductase
MQKQNNSLHITPNTLRVGITGQSGFIGSHLFNYLRNKTDIELILFEDNYFVNELELDEFVSRCDTIVHLAALNRHGEKGIIYKTNIDLVEKLLSSVRRTSAKPHIIMSSSTQEDLDNEYGLSKKVSREIFVKSHINEEIFFTGLIIPNVFGPFGNPFYNSFISTFSYQISNQLQPQIQVDSEVNLIYVLDLVSIIYDTIIHKNYSSELVVQHSFTFKVSEVLKKLYAFHDTYTINGAFPNFDNYFDLCLFNTFRSYIDSNYFPRPFKLNTDDRGSFVEVVKSSGTGQFSFSTTKPGITRGNHYHLRKVERFAVIHGKALIQLRKIGTDNIIEYQLDGKSPSYVDMPVYYTHNIKNTGDDDLLTLFWINEFYNPDDPDTYFETV